MNTNTKTIVALAAVVAISAILVGSVLANDAMAKKCYRGHNGGSSDSSRHNTLAQLAITNGEGNAQNNAAQNNGNDVAQIVAGNQPGN